MKKLILPCLLLTLSACLRKSPGYIPAKELGKKGVWTATTGEPGGWFTLYVGNSATTPTEAKQYILASQIEHCEARGEFISTTEPFDLVESMGPEKARRAFGRKAQAYAAAFFCRKTPKLIPSLTGDLVKTVEGQPIEHEWQLTRAVDAVARDHVSVQVLRGDKLVNLKVPVAPMTAEQIKERYAALKKQACEGLPVADVPAPKFCL